MFFDVLAVALLLLAGNIVFRHFEPFAPMWRRFLKAAGLLIATAAVSHYFGRTWLVVALAVAFVPVVYIHAIWLPRKGVNGWTAEPKVKYYALRGWPPPTAKP